MIATTKIKKKDRKLKQRPRAKKSGSEHVDIQSREIMQSDRQWIGWKIDIF